jgi:hypothetical protein
VFELGLCKPLVDAYVPTHDEIALEAVSTPSGGAIDPSIWVKQGFHGYFAPYPEWGGGTLATDFWRPLANVLFWLHYQLFGEHWGSQLVFGYLAHAAAVGVTAHLALNVLRLGRLPALMSILISALNPAVWSLYGCPYPFPYTLQFPIFQTEFGCGLLMLLAIVAFLQGRYLLFGVVTTFAVLLKETALTLPISALALTGAWLSGDRLKSAKNGLFLAMPVLIWFSLRHALFEHGGAVYVLTSSNRFGFLTQLIRNALLWPTAGLYWTLGQTQRDLAVHAWRAVAMQGIQLLANGLWWAALGFAAVRTIRSCGRRWFVDTPAPAVAALVFALGNLSLVLVLQMSQPRFGYLWFALGPAAVFAALSRACHAPASLAATSLTAALLLPRIVSMPDMFSRTSIACHRFTKQAAKSMTALLGDLPARVKKVYVVDDLVIQPVAPKYMAKLSGFRGELVLINSIQPVAHCERSSPVALRYHLRREGAADVLEYEAPECFQRGWRQAPAEQLEGGNVLKRGDWASYSFPQLSWGDRSLTKADAAYDEGKRWSVRISDPVCAETGACVWLGLDEGAGTYYVLVYDDEQAAGTR